MISPYKLVSVDELSEFQHTLTKEQRERVREHLYIFSRIENSAKPIKLAAQDIANCIRHTHPERGYSAKSLADKYRAYRKTKDWRILVPKYTNGDNRMGLPAPAFEQFRAWWISQASTCKRRDGIRGLYTQLIREWVSGHSSIPSFGTHQEWYHREFPDRPYRPVSIIRPDDLPRGFSYDTFLRLLPQRPSDRALIRTGFHDAHTATPDQLLRDVSQLRFLEVIVFDDVRFDIQILAKNEQGRLTPCYATGLVALDLATRTVVGFGIKPRLKREDDTHMGVCREDMRFLTLSIIERWGLPSYPITFLVENAAAAISHADEQGLLSTFGGNIIIDRTSLFERQLLPSGYRESGGTPWHKGWIEAFFRLLNCALASLPGTTGSRYDLDPGDLPARVNAAKALIKRVDEIGADMADFKPQLLFLEEFQDSVIRTMQALECRTDHKLQGFGEIHEWQDDSGQWHSLDDLLSLPEPDRIGIELYTRSEAPAERRARLLPLAQLRPQDPALYAHLYAEKRTLTCTNGKYLWRVNKGDDLLFRDQSNPLCAREHEGREYLAYLSTDHTQIHLTDKGRYLGSIARQGRVDYSDRKSILKASGEVHCAREADLAPLRETLTPAREQHAAADLHNRLEFNRATPLQDQFKHAEKSHARARTTALHNLDSSILAEPVTSGATHRPSLDGADLL
jgi:hypothetical protein